MNIRMSFIACALALSAATACIACPPGSDSQDAGVPEWMAKLVPAPDSPQAKVYAKQQKTRLETEKDLKLLRAKYFRATRNAEVRQVGFTKLHEYSDPALFPTLIDLFGYEHDGADVRDALLDHFAALKTDEADASLTWCAVFGKDQSMRDAAAKRIVSRVKDAGKPSLRVQTVIASGLKQTDNTPAAAAAQLAQSMKIYEAIPMMINAQLLQSGGATQSQDGGDAALAYILIGQQEAFVSDLTPVVGDAAVGFDPTVSVITSGTYIRVIDAYVITYRTEINAALIGLSTDGWGGQSTASLGWDNNAWQAWYANEFVPYRKKADAEKAAAAQDKADANRPL